MTGRLPKQRQMVWPKPRGPRRQRSLRMFGVSWWVQAPLIGSRLGLKDTPGGIRAIPACQPVGLQPNPACEKTHTADNPVPTQGVIAPHRISLRLPARLLRLPLKGGVMFGTDRIHPLRHKPQTWFTSCPGIGQEVSCWPQVSLLPGGVGETRAPPAVEPVGGTESARLPPRRSSPPSSRRGAMRRSETRQMLVTWAPLRRFLSSAKGKTCLIRYRRKTHPVRPVPRA